MPYELLLEELLPEELLPEEPFPEVLPASLLVWLPEEDSFEETSAVSAF